MKNTKKEIGKLGEDIACKFLRSKGFRIIGRNYLRKWGEIDVITKKGDTLHFIEVKSVSRENTTHQSAHYNNENDIYRAEDNIHPQKIKRLLRAIETYCAEENITADWHIDAVIVHIDTEKREALVKTIKDINL